MEIEKAARGDCLLCFLGDGLLGVGCVCLVTDVMDIMYYVSGNLNCNGWYFRLPRSLSICIIAHGVLDAFSYC